MCWELFHVILSSSLVVQWLRLRASIAGAWVQALVGEVRSRMPHSVAKNVCMYVCVYIYI